MASLCPRCNNPVISAKEGLIAFDKKWHRTCFTCERCGQSCLKFYEYFFDDDPKGRILHQPCATKRKLVGLIPTEEADRVTLAAVAADEWQDLWNLHTAAWNAIGRSPPPYAPYCRSALCSMPAVQASLALSPRRLQEVSNMSTSLPESARSIGATGSLPSPPTLVASGECSPAEGAIPDMSASVSSVPPLVMASPGGPETASSASGMVCCSVFHGNIDSASDGELARVEEQLRLLEVEGYCNLGVQSAVSWPVPGTPPALCSSLGPDAGSPCSTSEEAHVSQPYVGNTPYLATSDKDRSHSDIELDYSGTVHLVSSEDCAAYTGAVIRRRSCSRTPEPNSPELIATARGAGSTGGLAGSPSPAGGTSPNYAYVSFSPDSKLVPGNTDMSVSSVESTTGFAASPSSPQAVLALIPPKSLCNICPVHVLLYSTPSMGDQETNVDKYDADGLAKGQNGTDLHMGHSSAAPCHQAASPGPLSPLATAAVGSPNSPMIEAQAVVRQRGVLPQRRGSQAPTEQSQTSVDISAVCAAELTTTSVHDPAAKLDAKAALVAEKKARIAVLKLQLAKHSEAETPHSLQQQTVPRAGLVPSGDAASTPLATSTVHARAPDASPQMLAHPDMASLGPIPPDQAVNSDSAATAVATTTESCMSGQTRGSGSVLPMDPPSACRPSPSVSSPASAPAPDAAPAPALAQPVPSHKRKKKRFTKIEPRPMPGPITGSLQGPAQGMDEHNTLLTHDGDNGAVRTAAISKQNASNSSYSSLLPRASQAPATREASSCSGSPGHPDRHAADPGLTPPELQPIIDPPVQSPKDARLASWQDPIPPGSSVSSALEVSSFSGLHASPPNSAMRSSNTSKPSSEYKHVPRSLVAEGMKVSPGCESQGSLPGAEIGGSITTGQRCISPRGAGCPPLCGADDNDVLLHTCAASDTAGVAQRCKNAVALDHTTGQQEHRSHLVTAAPHCLPVQSGTVKNDSIDQSSPSSTLISSKQYTLAHETLQEPLCVPEAATAASNGAEPLSLQARDIPAQTRAPLQAVQHAVPLLSSNNSPDHGHAVSTHNCRVPDKAPCGPGTCKPDACSAQTDTAPVDLIMDVGRWLDKHGLSHYSKVLAGITSQELVRMSEAELAAICPVAGSVVFRSLPSEDVASCLWSGAQLDPHWVVSATKQELAKQFGDLAAAIHQALHAGPTQLATCNPQPCLSIGYETSAEQVPQWLHANGYAEWAGELNGLSGKQLGCLSLRDLQLKCGEAANPLFAALHKVPDCLMIDADAAATSHWLRLNGFGDCLKALDGLDAQALYSMSVNDISISCPKLGLALHAYLRSHGAPVPEISFTSPPNRVAA
eukprot:gene7329-178_t